MFSVRDGWLRYAPFDSGYTLPYLQPVGEYPLVHQMFNKAVGGSSVVDERKEMCWKLVWPGSGQTEDVLIPWDIAAAWPGIDKKTYKKYAKKGIPLKLLVDEGMVLPPGAYWQMPPSIAYHLSVNADFYKPEGPLFWPVAGLMDHTVERIIKARFVIPPAVRMLLDQLKQQAELSTIHVLRKAAVDTQIREMMFEVPVKCAEVFFRILFDYQYNDKTKWYTRGDERLDSRYAHYLQLVGRTGEGLYGTYSGLCGAYDSDDLKARKACFNSLDEDGAYSIAGMKDRMEFFKNHDGRNYAHVDFKDPAVITHIKKG